MVIDAKEKTALATSVGADERQSIQLCNTNIISTESTEINCHDDNSSEKLEEIYRQMQRMNNPAYLHTVSMNELYMQRNSVQDLTNNLKSLSVTIPTLD